MRYCASLSALSRSMKSRSWSGRTSPASHAVQFFEIEQEGAAEAGLLEVVVAHGLERRAQAEVHCRVAKEVEAIFARQRGQTNAVAAE